MNRFYIEKLVVSGGGHEASVLDFCPGLNFVLGPSQTGKTLVMECIDYAFGFIPKNDQPSKIVENSHGYERMLAVMNQAAIMPLENYLLSASPYWISGNIKKGVCHHLVNARKLKWVRGKR